MKKWTADELEVMAEALFWHQHKDQMASLGITTLEQLRELHKSSPGEQEKYVWSKGDGTANDPPVFATDIYEAEGSQIKWELFQSIPEALRRWTPREARP